MTTLRWLLSVVCVATVLAATPAFAGATFFFSFGGHGWHHGFHKHHLHFKDPFFRGVPHHHRFDRHFRFHGHPKFFHHPFRHHHLFFPHVWRRW